MQPIHTQGTPAGQPPNQGHVPAQTLGQSHTPIIMQGQQMGSQAQNHVHMPNQMMTQPQSQVRFQGQNGVQGHLQSQMQAQMQGQLAAQMAGQMHMQIGNQLPQSGPVMRQPSPQSIAPQAPLPAFAGQVQQQWPGTVPRSATPGTMVQPQGMQLQRPSVNMVQNHAQLIHAQQARQAAAAHAQQQTAGLHSSAALQAVGMQSNMAQRNRGTDDINRMILPELTNEQKEEYLALKRQMLNCKASDPDLHKAKKAELFAKLQQWLPREKLQQVLNNAMVQRGGPTPGAPAFPPGQPGAPGIPRPQALQRPVLQQFNTLQQPVYRQEGSQMMAHVQQSAGVGRPNELPPRSPPITGTTLETQQNRAVHPVMKRELPSSDAGHRTKKPKTEDDNIVGGVNVENEGLAMLGGAATVLRNSAAAATQVKDPCLSEIALQTVAKTIADRHGVQSWSPDVNLYMNLAVERHLCDLLSKAQQIAALRNDGPRRRDPLSTPTHHPHKGLLDIERRERERAAAEKAQEEAALADAARKGSSKGKEAKAMQEKEKEKSATVNIQNALTAAMGSKRKGWMSGDGSGSIGGGRSLLGKKKASAKKGSAGTPPPDSQGTPPAAGGAAVPAAAAASKPPTGAPKRAPQPPPKPLSGALQEPVTVTLSDLAVVLERHAKYCRSTLLYKLHNQLGAKT